MKQYIAEAKNIKVSPRKVRLVVEGVKHSPIQTALAILSTTSKRAGEPVKKVLESAVANAVNNGQIKKEDLFISEMLVNEGIAYKRFHFAGRGRTRPYKKRTSHIKVILGVKQEEVPAPIAAVKEEVKEEKTMKKEVKKGGAK